MKKSFIFLVAVISVGYADEASARRRHRHSKGVIIVNQILKLDGTITRNGEAAPEFSGVKNGDILETGEKSMAVIRIPGLGLFRMGPKTKFKLTQFTDRDKSRLELIDGEVKALIRRLGDHELKLPHGALLPYGSTFIATTKPDEKADDFVLCSGKVQVKATEAAPEPSPMAVALTAGPRVKEMLISNDSPNKEVHITSGGILSEPAQSKKTCDPKLISDLESLYALP